MSNEITVKLECSIKEICNILESKDFRIIRKFILDDTYFIPCTLQLEKMNSRNILSTAILLRNITDFIPKEKNTIKLTFKNKQIDNNGNILNQSKTDCKILNLNDGRLFLEAVGYKEIMKIKESDIVYKNSNLEIIVKDVENGDNLLEIETVDTCNKLDSTEKLIKIIDNLDLPIINNNYFVKKAEIELNKILKKL